MGSRRSSGFRPLLLLLVVISLCIHLAHVSVLAAAAAADRTPCSRDHNAVAPEGELRLCESIKRRELSSVSMKGGGGGRGGGGGGRGGGFGFHFGRHRHSGGAELTGASLTGHLALAVILAAALLVC
ncbi:unnamed protein product [Linum trigynum]|uniref:Uncharacterized protein n=1 Tax=Linum trigynum TaxID=586398 RepID=A0AAV2D6P4_9ROSI